MLNFKQYLTEQELLNEKLLLINNGKKYGQIVFLAGGAASGKGFASANFMNNQDYKVRDVDEMKKLFLTLNKLKHKYPELDGLNLKNPKDVFKLHAFVEKKGTVDSSMKHLIKGMTKPETLPNILFDVTLKNIKKIKETMPDLIAAGYKAENTHLVWILTDYTVAVQANKTRERVVPDDILLQTHVGAHKTMWDIIGKNNVPKEINGGIYVVLNNRENTVFFKDTDKKDYRSAKDDKDADDRKTTGLTNSKGKHVSIIKDFKYLTYKEPKKSPKTDKAIHAQLASWVFDNVPLTNDGVFKDF